MYLITDFGDPPGRRGRIHCCRGQAEWLFGSPRATFDVDLCFGGLNIKVIALDDLIKIKQNIRRPKDQESLFQLLAIKKARGEAKSFFVY